MNIIKNAVKSKYKIKTPCNNPVVTKNLDNSLSLSFNSSTTDIHIYKSLNACEKPAKKYSHSKSYDKIKKNDFNLNISRYVDTFESKTEIKAAQKNRYTFKIS